MSREREAEREVERKLRFQLQHIKLGDNFRLDFVVASVVAAVVVVFVEPTESQTFFFL